MYMTAVVFSMRCVCHKARDILRSAAPNLFPQHLRSPAFRFKSPHAVAKTGRRVHRYIVTWFAPGRQPAEMTARE